MTFKKFLEKLFSLDNLKFSRIVIKKEVIDNICYFARANYPNEFIALLEGDVKDRILFIHGLIYQPFSKSRHAASISVGMSAPSNYVGSVHSHPSRNSIPSGTDLASFNKRGAVHLIINYPYTPENIKGYDFNGNAVGFEVL